MNSLIINEVTMIKCIGLVMASTTVTGQ